MPQYIPHPSLMGLQQGNEMTNNYMRMYDTQTSNFVNNMARTLAQREQNVYNVLTNMAAVRSAAAGGAGGAGGTGGNVPAIPKLSENPEIQQYLNNVYAQNLGLTGRDLQGNQVGPNVMPVYGMVSVPGSTLYGPSSALQWQGAAGGPSLQQIQELPFTIGVPQKKESTAKRTEQEGG